MSTKFYSLLAASLLAGCATQQVPMTPLDTASGKPEIFVMGKTKQQVIDGVVAACSLKGSMVDTPNDSMVICYQEDTSYRANVMLGTTGGQLIGRNQFYISPVDQGFRVQLLNAWYENMNGYGGVQKTQLNITHGLQAQEYQKMMVRIEASINGTPIPVQ